MKILFICGTLEPGHDGVGDYTIRLGNELLRQENKVAAIALYDRFTDDVLESTEQEIEVFMPVLRISSKVPEKKRFYRAKDFINSFKPDFISLQYVPYAYHAKGLPCVLALTLRGFGKEKLWHIMFHELWIGMEVNAAKSFKFWGWFQKLLIKLIIFYLSPPVIHTQTVLYQRQLEKLGFKANYLPLFSNIPVITKNCSEEGHEEISKCSSKILILVLFGVIHRSLLLKSFSEEVACYSKHNNVRVVLKLIGRNGIEQNYWVSAWKKVGLDIEVLGEQSPKQISKIFQEASLGISTTPLALLEKSGSVAAMREHGLNVLCVRENWEVKGFDNNTHLSGVVHYQKGNFEHCICNLKRITVSASLKETAKQFADSLLTAKYHLSIPHIAK